ncbi:MAG TPA: GrpB family protein [Gemmatimonadaceae bacterium]|nr:GrpB family protein [Gemmatimonadaceae bacterium]
MRDASPREPRNRPDGAIVLAPHSAGWAGAFEREASTIVKALAPVPIELHHIGSTAIPDIAAKPVIDILGIVPAIGVIDAEAHRLTAVGYEALGEFGIPGRRYFRKNAPDGVRTHQLHVFALGSPEIQRHLDFRDYLRAFPSEAAAYSALKQELAERCGSDMRAYTEGKTDFIRGVERRAASWRRPPEPAE